jgi:hypothetical protein
VGSTNRISTRLCTGVSGNEIVGGGGGTGGRFRFASVIQSLNCASVEGVAVNGVVGEGGGGGSRSSFKEAPNVRLSELRRKNGGAGEGGVWRDVVVDEIDEDE